MLRNEYSPPKFWPAAGDHVGSQNRVIDRTAAGAPVQRDHLLFALGYPVKQVAEIMGIHEQTVRRNRRIAAKLGIDLSGDEEKE
ncbi:helix-turn-helix domain-containing protein [Streptomyces sp. NPDC046727]|uniref:helix-turn-helix domain-containing protein n=1 Tax=Streptomyces sp. NPDC046727 TaxID=3155373 RepID=UPI00340C294C